MPIVSNADSFTKQAFDYIIIGGGTAGLVVAARLSEDPNVTVGVLEAGPQHEDGNPLIDVPAMMGKTVGNPEYDWMSMTTPQEYANNRAIFVSRGKGLGGTSTTNFMYMSRPSKEEFDRLEALGNKGWNWDSLLHYLKKSETLTPIPPSASRFGVDTKEEVHGSNGPIQKKLGTVYDESFHDDVITAAKNAGFPSNPDANAGDIAGISTGFFSIDPSTGKRSYSVSGYLHPNLNRPNLLVLAGAHVRKVVFQEESGLQRATGVEFIRDGAVAKVSVKKEVIVSAGTLGSPGVLEHSGIGNTEILSRLSIPTVVDLPGVGENFQDHVMVFGIGKTEKYETFDILNDPEQLRKHQELYAKKQGLLASMAGPAVGYMSAKHLGTPEQVAAWQEQLNDPASLIPSTVPESVKKGILKQYDLVAKTFSEQSSVQGEAAVAAAALPTPHHVSIPGERYITAVSFIGQPLSRGHIHINSTDPLSPPSLDPRYFSVPSDFDKLVGTFKAAVKLCRTTPLADSLDGFVLPAIPNDCDEERLDKVLKEHVQETFLSGLHPIGSASMLPREDGGVVDRRLIVYGTSNVRVADLSILPLQISTHPQMTAYAIGEKAADLIKSSE